MTRAGHAIDCKRDGVLPRWARLHTRAAACAVLLFSIGCGTSFTSASEKEDDSRGGEGGIDSGTGGSSGGTSGNSSSGAAGEADGGEGAASTGGHSSGGSSIGGSAGNAGGTDTTGGIGGASGSPSGQGGGGAAGQVMGGANGSGGSGASAGSGGEPCLPTVIATALPAMFTWESFTDSVFTGSQTACTYCSASPCGPCSVSWGTAAQGGENVLVPITMGSCSVPGRYGTCGVPSGQGACTLSGTVRNAVATLRVTRTSTGFEVSGAELAASWDGTGCADYFSDANVAASVNASLRAALVGVSASCP